MGHLLVFFLVMSIYLVWVVLEDKKEKKRKKGQPFFPSRENYGCPVFLLLIDEFRKARKKVQVLSACECFMPVIRNNPVWTRDHIRKEKMS